MPITNIRPIGYRTSYCGVLYYHNSSYRLVVTVTPAVRGTTFHPLLLTTKAQACVGRDNLPHMSRI